VVVKDYNDFLEYISFESYIHIYFYDEEDKLSHATQVYDEAQDEVLELGGEVIEEKEEASSFYTSLSKELEKIKKHIQVLLNDIKDTNSFTSYMWLLFFSFVYGVIHAMGPGHGKSLVSAYFLSKNASYIKALNISLLIGVVHTFSAFIITLVIYYVLGIIFLNSAANIEIYATKISAIIIILIAIYLIYKKIPKKQKIVSFSTTKPHASSCSCSGCNTHSTDIGVILAAGIIPCPGTVTIFIFTMSLGVYFVGFLSAVFMSLGMSFIIFISAFASIKLKHQTNSNETLKKVFEYGSLVFILCLGILLLVY
jgi:ABC-type nickel/cobalt efflux system permease component RcnA